MELDPAEVVEGKDILDVFQCNLCKGIPIPPIKECKHCEVLFCESCLELRQHFVRCPACKYGMSQPRKINRQVMMITGEKLRFRHKCNKTDGKSESELADNQTPDAKQPLECGYEEMIKHLKHECKAKANLSCICAGLKESQDKPTDNMTLSDLKSHIINSCPLSLVECTKCFKECARKDFVRHEDTQCIKNLQDQLRKLEYEV